MCNTCEKLKLTLARCKARCNEVYRSAAGWTGTIDGERAVVRSAADNLYRHQKTHTEEDGMNTLERLAVMLAAVWSDKAAIYDRFPLESGSLGDFSCDEERAAYVAVYHRERAIIKEIAEIGASMLDTTPRMSSAAAAPVDGEVSP